MVELKQVQSYCEQYSVIGKPQLVVYTIKGTTYITHPLVLFLCLSRKTIVLRYNKQTWFDLIRLLKRFVPVVATPEKVQFRLKLKVFTVLNGSEWLLREGYLGTLLFRPLFWHTELSYLRSLKPSHFYTETPRLGGITCNSIYEIPIGLSYDLTSFYTSIGIAVGIRPISLSPLGWQQAWVSEEHWGVYVGFGSLYRASPQVNALAADVLVVLCRLLYPNLLQKSPTLGIRLANYFIGLLSTINSSFNFITSRGRRIIRFRIPYSPFRNKNIDSIW